jgi:large subunit ribosomal protein L10
MPNRKGRGKVPKWKIDTVETLVKTLKDASVVGSVDLKETPADYLKRVRFDLRDDFTLIFARKNLIHLAFDKLGWKEFKEQLGEMPALIISNVGPFKLYKKISNKKSPTFAKAGQVANADIMVSGGPTSIPAGPVLGDFQKAGLPAKIQEGKLAVIKDTVVAKKGSAIEDNVAAILRKLDIKPFSIMLNVLSVKEGSTIYPVDVLHIDEAEIFQKFVNAHSWAFNLALESGYPTKETLELLILDAFQKARALAISEALLEPEVIEDLLAMANYHANSIGGEEVEYVYAAMLLHKAGQQVNEDSVKKVLSAAGTKVDDARVKALVAALEGVNIDEAIKKAPTMAAAPAAAAPAPAAGAPAADKKKSAEEEKKSEEEAASGLAALFG